jgi:hypothetical protein
VRSTRLAISAVLVALVTGGFALAPAEAATKPAPKPVEDTWVGRIQKDGAHDDYVGRACPESAQVCTDIVATYRIVPLSPGAGRAVRRLSGGPGRLTGHLQPGGGGPRYSGTLFVRKAERPRPSSATVSADETSNGTTVRLRPGDHLQVVLHSTYWAFNDPSDPAVISADGQPVYGPGRNCPTFPGSGCGTVTVRYTAHKAGSAVVSADRGSCGEAMRCVPPNASHWEITVRVTA